MPVPPRPVRRLVVAPLVVAVELLLLAASPLVLVIAVLLSPAFGGWRPLRMALVVLVFVARHLATVLACLVLWLLRRGEREHYALMGWFVGGVSRAIEQLADVHVAEGDASGARAVLSARRAPVVVLARHAGEGDTLLVVHELLCRHGRRPHLVMHRVLQLDPVIDVLGHRLPNRFLDPRGGDTERDIAELAQSLGPEDALVIFPEGVNFSEAARRRGIERLERAGRTRQAAWARGMRHVAAPRPGGALAAIDGAPPDADVVVLGHAGFPRGLGEVWRLLPRPQTITVRLWHEPASALPEGTAERIDWLFAWWREVDAWVDGQVAPPGDATASAPAP